MVKFFDINNAKPATEAKTEKPEMEKDITKEPIRVEPEVASVPTSTVDEKPVEKPEPKEEKQDEKPEKVSDGNDDAPQAPDIPRATPSMAPKESEHVESAQMGAMIQSGGKKQKIVTAILSTVLIVLLALLVSQAVIFFTQTRKQQAVTPKSDDTPKVETKTDTSKTDTKTTAPTAADTTPKTDTSAAVTPASTELTKEKASIRVLNGSGVTGAATKIAAVMKSAGYTVSGTANAKSYTYATTLVLYKNSDGKTLAEALAKDLVGYTVEVKLDATTVGSSSDILVIVGKK